MSKYYGIRKILLSGLKLKGIRQNIYTKNFTDWVEDRDGYTVCDSSKFAVNGRKLYYIKHCITATSTTQIQELEVGDIFCDTTDSNQYKIFYSKDDTPVIKDYIVLTTNLKQYLSFGGNETRKLAEEVIGILVIPNSIEGERVPDFLYYSQIDPWIGLLKYLKSRGYCCKADFDRFGGEPMLDFLQSEIIPLPNYDLVVPSVKLPLFLRQNYSDVGVLTTYDETMDFDSSLPENAGLGVQRVNVSISAESKLTTLRSRKREYNEQTGALEDFIIVGGEKVVPYEIGGDGSLSANTFNTYYLGDGKYLGDFVTKIVYLDDDGNVTDKYSATQIEFEYVIGGIFTGKDIIDWDECEIELIDIPESGVITIPATGTSGEHIDFSSNCDWSIYVVFGEDEFLNLRHGDDYDEEVVINNQHLHVLSIDDVSGFGSVELVEVESNTTWRLVNIPDDVDFSLDYGVDFRDIYLTVKPYNSGGISGYRTITAATVEYGSSYGNSKYIMVKQKLEYIMINGQTTCYWSNLDSAATTNIFSVDSSFADWSIISTPDWCIPSYQSSSQLKVDVLQNDTIYPREGEIVIGKDGVYATLKVSQKRGTSYLIDVFRIVEGDDGVTAKSYDDVYLDGYEEALFGIEVYNMENIEFPINPTPSWNYVNISETFNNEAVVDSDNYIDKHDSDFVFTNKFRGPGEAHGKVHVYLTDAPNCSATTPTIYLSKYMLLVAPEDCPGIDEQLMECDYENGEILDFCDEIEQALKVFTNIETGWTVEIEFGPYLSIDATSLTYDCTSTYQKVQVGSNITWYFTKQYITLTESLNDYEYVFEPDEEPFEPTKEQKLAQMYANGLYVDNGEYVYVHITEKQYLEREDQEVEYQLIYTDVPLSGMTPENSSKYIKLTSTGEYWMLIPNPDWCTVLPDNGSMDTEVGIFVDENQYNERYLVLHLNQFEDIVDEDGNSVMVKPFDLFIIQGQCESDNPEIEVDTDELIFTSNTDWARVQITSNTSWIGSVFVEWDGEGGTPGSDISDPEYGMLPTKYALVEKLTGAVAYDYVEVYDDPEHNGLWKKITTPPSEINVVEDRGEWCTVIPEEGTGSQVSVVFVRTNNSGDDRKARLVISEYGNTSTDIIPSVIKILQLGRDDEAVLYISSGYTHYGETQDISRDKQWFENQYERGIFSDGYLILDNQCNASVHVDAFTTVHEG